MTLRTADDVDVPPAGFLHGHAGNQGPIHGDGAAADRTAPPLFLFALLVVAEGASLDGAALLVVFLGGEGAVHL